MNRKDLLQFTMTLSELMNSDMTLHSALEMMSRMSGLRNNCSLAALEIKNYLAEGSRFSLALKKCQTIDFDEVFIAFVCSAEKSGRIEQTLDYLKKREMAKNNMAGKFLTMTAYPGFVIFMTFVGGLVMAIFSSKLVADLSGDFDFVQYKKDVVSGCVQANLFLIAAVFGLVKILKNLLMKNTQLDVFRVLDFMTESGIGFYSALETSLLLAERDSKIKKQILKTMSDISHGKKVCESVGNFGKDFELYAQVAESSGNLEKVFKQICGNLESKFLKIEKLCMDLTNPAIMCVAGIYIMILLKKIAMPVLFNFGI